MSRSCNSVPRGCTRCHRQGAHGPLPPVSTIPAGSRTVSGSNGTHLTGFEEDEPLILHPRNPYVRVDSLRSHRHIRVVLDGVVLAETHSPVLLFETGLPTRFYIDRTDIEFSRLEPSKTESLCPYKGVTSAYWTFRNGDAVYPDIAWAYNYPLREVAPIAGMIAFYNEKLDIFVDGALLSRPQTIFT
jgi:uncharacterized protein (DUF427 family)